MECHCCLSVDTIIPTVDGCKRLEDIEYDDIVFNANNEPTKVLFTSEVGEVDDIIELGFASESGGENFVRCCRNTEFIVLGDEDSILTEADKLSIGDCVFGSNNSCWTIVGKETLYNEKVKYINIDSKINIFLFDNAPDDGWLGGLVYPKSTLIS